MIVVVSGEDQTVARQRENLLRDRVIERGGVTVLEIGPPTAVDQQGVAGEGAKTIGLIDQVGMVGIGVPRRKQRLKLERADGQGLVLGDADVSTRKAVHGGVRDLGAGKAAQIAGRGDMVRMHMRLQRIGQFEIQFLKCGKVAFDRFEDRIDEDGFARFRAAEEVGVCRGLGFEQLTKDHDRPPMVLSCRSRPGCGTACRRPRPAGRKRRCG